VAPSIPARLPEAEHLEAIADPALLGREQRTLAISDVRQPAAETASGDQPRWRTMSGSGW